MPAPNKRASDYRGAHGQTRSAGAMAKVPGAPVRSAKDSILAKLKSLPRPVKVVAAAGLASILILLLAQLYKARKLKAAR